MTASAAQELLTPHEMARVDQQTIARGTPGIELMLRAGAAVASAARDMLSRSRHGTVAVLCGPGNNGGDGFVAGRDLAAQGVAVHLYLLGASEGLRGDAREARALWSGPVKPLDRLDLAGVELVVDALFGAGLSRDLDGVAALAVRRVNEAGVPVLAVDVPSGVDGASGLVGGVAIKADCTVTFFRAKPGHYLYPGAARRGRLEVADIGIPGDILDSVLPRTVLNTPALWQHRYPWPVTDGHKYKRGHVVVASGSLSHTGAARMSALAALRIGAGLVTLASPADALAVNAAQLTAIMLREANGADGLAAVLTDRRKNGVVLGPGLGVGNDTAAMVGAALSPRSDGGTGSEVDGRAVVLDADALTSFEGAAARLATLIAKASGPVVITPHDGEFARLFSADPDVIGAAAKPDKARSAARLLGCTVLLKGADTVIAAPDGCTSISFGDAPWLATAGSGDVLSGLIGGLLAQGMPAFLGANAAAWIHAAAARRFGPGLIAEDLPHCVPGVLADLQGAVKAT